MRFRLIALLSLLIAGQFATPVSCFRWWSVQRSALSKPDRLVSKRLVGPNDPIRKTVTSAGPVYKTDEWLFAANCEAVDLAYRTFSDARYDNACAAT
jgi:hypothetical protein